MNALDILIERILANANPSNMYWLKDNAEQAAAALAELREKISVLDNDLFSAREKLADAYTALGRVHKLRIDLIDECIKTQRRAERAETTLDKARKVIENMPRLSTYPEATALLEKFKEQP